MQQRLVNCKFIIDMTKVSNKAKLLYLMLFVNADDWGFVGNTENIIETLDNNDAQYLNQVNLSLLENDYKSALNELYQKGFLFEFVNTHGNKVYLIRHWFLHNKYYSKGWTNYKRYLKRVKVVDGEYVYRRNNEPQLESDSDLENDPPLETEKKTNRQQLLERLRTQEESDE